jgi:hypothetical protein
MLTKVKLRCREIISKLMVFLGLERCSESSQKVVEKVPCYRTRSVQDVMTPILPKPMQAIWTCETIVKLLDIKKVAILRLTYEQILYNSV